MGPIWAPHAQMPISLPYGKSIWARYKFQMGSPCPRAHIKSTWAPNGRAGRGVSALPEIVTLQRSGRWSSIKTDIVRISWLVPLLTVTIIPTLTTSSAQTNTRSELTGSIMQLCSKSAVLQLSLTYVASDGAISPGIRSPAKHQLTDRPRPIDVKDTARQIFQCLTNCVTLKMTCSQIICCTHKLWFAKCAVSTDVRGKSPELTVLIFAVL